MARSLQRPLRRHDEARAERHRVPPAPRHDVVARPLLLEQLRSLTRRRLTLLVAPTGYGKTTLLAQWALEEVRPVAWLALATGDAEPRRFVRRLVAAVEAARPELRVGAGDSAPPEQQLEALVNAAASTPGELVVVLDDFHAVSGACAALLADLLDRPPAGLHLVVSARTRPALPVARLAAAGELAVLGPEELRLDRAEMGEVARRIGGVDLDADGRARLEQRTEGWPAGVRLAAASGRASVVDDYLRDEVLGPLPDELRAFLSRTAVLERPTPGLCDALLGRRDSARLLDDAERAGLVLVRDRAGRRFHPQLANLLRAELRRERPAEERDLHLRAARLCERAGRDEAAVRHLLAAGDGRGARALVVARLPQLVRLARAGDAAALLDALCVDDGVHDPALALARAWVAAVADRPEEEVERLLALVSGRARGPLPFGSGETESEAALVRAARPGLDAVDRLGRAEAAAQALPARAGRLAERTAAAHVATALLAEGRCADALAAAQGEPVDPAAAPAAAVTVCAVRSLALSRLGRRAEAGGPARAAAALARRFGLHDPLAVLALGRATGDERLLQEAADAPAWLRAWALAELALARAPDDGGAAQAALAEARMLLAGAPHPGVAAEAAVEAEARLRSAARGRVREQTELSGAELRVLRLLPSRLTQREIAGELYVSLNTVKTHACSIYRKLGVSSRAEAVRAARAVNLV